MCPGEEPLVSVICPTYQQHQYLATAVLSVIAQSFPNIELLIVSVKEDEETNQQINKLEATFSIKSLKSEKPNHIHQINLGLKEAKGQFVILFGSDDFMLPNKVATEMALATARNAVLVYSRFFITDEHLNIGLIPPLPPFSYSRLVQGNFIVDSCLVAKHLYDEFDHFDESLSSLAVYDKWLHIAEKYENQMVFNNIPVILYRTHPQQKHESRLADPKQLELYNKIVKASLQRKGLPTDQVNFKLHTVKSERV